ncbi:MAG: ClpXP protease specificity-enhancing factor [Kangiellaceae bacterium]|nr:ClpXP protease specificity-enhancing factor [Kangiellaceae bacterium]
MAGSAPLQPYLLIAYYEWIVDNEWTPQILVDVSLPNVDVPQQFANDGKIVLNISPSAVAHFEMDHEHISFSARFSGSSLSIYVPTNAILAIYARENEQGIMFSPNMYGEHSEGNGDDEPPTPEPSKTAKDRSFLKVVK